ncbi:MAG TPA: S8 family serine peptidase, partial [Candidatus Thermoplasmatota archaeon]|nr:S8 family serine peptidase [Candidatus Thermoplasmatota archaeon]
MARGPRGIEHGHASFRRAFGTQHVILQGAEAPSPHARELAPGWWSIRFESAWSALREARRLADEADAHDAQQVILPPRVLHHVPNDPYFSQQWHLRNTGQRGATAGIDANLPAAWETVRGSGINISVVDDGTEYTHPDLAPAYRGGSGSWDHCDNDPDPAPVGDESHGTAVTGVAAARGDNGIGVSGAAPAASFSAHRFLCAGSGDPAAPLGAGTNDIHISTNSWGYSGTGLVPLSGATAAALANNILNGRDGKGQVYLFAAGNSRSEGHDANYQGLTASRYVITVGAIGADGHVSHYSSPCACLLLGAPSNSAGLPGIATTDRTGAAGYNDGAEFHDASYTTGFGGTSSATPLVAGVVALLLEANPDLTWREVQGVLAASARRSGLGPTTWTTNAAGYATSRDFGFGMVDAGSAVRRAQTWIPWTPELATSATNSTRLPVPDAGPEVTASLDLPLDLRIERVVLTLSAEHPWRGDLRVELESPAGTRSRVIPGRPADAGDDFHAWQASSTQFFGERSAGRWKLHVRDLAALDVGAVTSFSITAYGRAVDVAPPVVVDATVSASRLDLEFDEPIDAYFLPAASAFSISRDGSPESPSAVSIAGPRVSLALSTPVTDTQVLAVTYAPPGTDFLRDAQGNAVPGFASLPVENVNPDVTPPTVELTTVPIAPDGGDGWFVSAATASLSATDATSPVSSVLYCISPSDDCAPNVPYVGPIALPEGPTRYLRYQATDAASNPSPVGSYAFKVDLRPPAVFANFTPGPSPSGWWLTQPTAVLEASDATSGVEALLYCVDTEGACAPTTPYSAAILLEAPLRRLRYTAADAAGNVAPAATVDVRADITPPTLTASVSPAAPDAGEWYTTRPVLSVSASDPESGIASVRYCTDVDDTCDPTAEVDGEIAVPDGSPRYVRIRATNGAGNSSAVLSVALKVDVEAPALSFQTDPAAPDGAASWFITAPTVAIHAVDAGQGVADLRYCVDTSDTCDPLADGQEYLAPISLGMGITYVRARAVDELGRANVLSSAFRVDLEDPLASLEISPAVGDGPDGWWTAPPAYAWTTSDVGSGVAGRFYCVDPTGACVPDLVWPEGDAAPPLPDGPFVLRYRVLDAAGRASVPGSLPLKLDTLPPAFVAHVTPATPDGIGGWYNQDVTLVLEAVDSGSGILAGSVETSADGGASWQAVAGASASFELTEGVTTLRLRATDNVGRAATSDDHVVRIDLTPPTVSATPAVSGSAASVTFAFSEPMDVAST